MGTSYSIAVLAPAQSGVYAPQASALTMQIGLPCDGNISLLRFLLQN